MKVLKLDGSGKTRSRYLQADDGDVLCIGADGFFYLTCCDCLLTHRVDVSIVGREARLRVNRDERRTSQKRRRFAEREQGTDASNTS